MKGIFYKMYDQTMAPRTFGGVEKKYPRLGEVNPSDLRAGEVIR